MWIQIDFLKGVIRCPLQGFGDKHQLLLERLRIISKYCFLCPHCCADNGRQAGKNFNLPQVEYPLGASGEHTALSILEGAAADIWKWGEVLVGAGGQPFCRALAQVARQQLGSGSRRNFLRAGQTVLVDNDIMMPCGVGACYLCAVETRAGQQLACRDGPVLDLDAWTT